MKYLKLIGNIRGIPLVLAFIAFPLYNIIMTGTATSAAMDRIWLDIAWGVLAFIALVFLSLKKTLDPVWPLLLWGLAGLCIVRAGFALDTNVQMDAFLMELKPLFYFGFAFLWLNSVRAPELEMFVTAGSALSVIIVGDFVFESMAHGVLSRPIGSGEINYDACLLVLSFAVALNTPRSRKPVVLLIFAAIIATMSRTAQVAAAAVLLTTDSIGVSLKSTMVAVPGVAFIFSFYARALSLDYGTVDRFFMWRSALRLFQERPLNALCGFPLGVGLPIQMPIHLRELWTQQTRDWNLDGTFAFNFHAMWLRLAISWGIAVSLTLLVLLIVWARRNRTRLALALVLIIAIEGMTMGVFYLSNVSVPLLILIIAINRRNLPKYSRVTASVRAQLRSRRQEAASPLAFSRTS